MEITKVIRGEDIFIFILDYEGYEVELVIQIYFRKEVVILSIETAWGEAYRETIKNQITSISDLYYSMRKFLIERDFDVNWLDEDYIKYMDFKDAESDYLLPIIAKLDYFSPII